MVELVVVIVVLGVLAAGTTKYIVDSMEAYSSTVRRDQLASTSRLAVERVVRELRNALPNSVRIDTNTVAGVTTHCLEFFPIKRASAYLTLPTTAANISFSSVNFTKPATDDGFYIAVYPHNTSTLYTQPIPGPIKDFHFINSDPANGIVALTANHQFDYHSARKRFFLVNHPVSFCINTPGELRRYTDYGIIAAQATPPTTATDDALLAEDLQLTDGVAITPFTFDPGTLTRAGVVTLDFRFMEDNEWVRLLQEVQIRNVP